MAALHSSTQPSSSIYQPLAMVVGSCISLQVGAALATELFKFSSSWSVTFVRLACAAVILIAIIRPRIRHWTSQQWSIVALYGGATALMNGFFYASIARIPLGIAVTIEFTGPLLLSAALSRSVRDLLWVGFAACGLILMGMESLPTHSANSLDPVGMLYALIAGVFWAAYVLTSKKAGSLVAGQSGLAIGLAIGTVILAPIGLSDSFVLFTDPRLLALAIGTAVLASLVPYSLELAALRHLPPAVFGILLSLEPVFAAIFGWLLLNQGLTWVQAFAILAVVCASAGTTWSASRKPPPR